MEKFFMENERDRLIEEFKNLEQSYKDLADDYERLKERLESLIESEKLNESHIIDK